MGGLLEPLSSWPTEQTGLTARRVDKGTSKFYEEDRGVDLLFIGSKDKAYNTAAVQVLMLFHPKPAVLVLRGVLDEKPVRYESHQVGGKILLGNGQQHEPYQKRHRLKHGGVKYTQEIEVLTEAGYSSYRFLRDSMYTVVQKPRGHPLTHL